MKKLTLALCLALSGQALANESIAIGDTAGNTLKPGNDAIDLPVLNNHRETVSYSWAINDSQLESTPAPFTQLSRQYVLDTTGEKLFKGVTINTTARGAVLRITPLEAQADLDLTADDVVLGKGKRTWTGAQNNQAFASHAQLKAAGVDFGKGTAALRVAPEVGSGAINLRVTNAALASDQQRFVVHVFEPESAYALQMQAKQDRFKVGAQAELSLSLQGAAALDTASVRGFLLAPDGQTSLPLNFSKSADNQLIASASISEPAQWVPGLWEAHTYLRTEDNGQMIMRDATTAFAVSPGTAELAGRVKVNPANLSADVALQVAVEGRYQVGGVLFGTHSDGSMKPMAATQTAAWLNPGQQQITLSVTPDLVAESGLTAPFELRDISLTDQSRLAKLEASNKSIRFE